MAIFKKLFIGDKVVASGSKVFKKLSPLSPQIGTWIFNTPFDWTGMKWEYIANINFTSNNEEFDQLYFNAMNYKAYYKPKGQSILFEVYENDEWQVDEAYKTITITGGEDIDGDETKIILYIFATKQ